LPQPAEKLGLPSPLAPSSLRKKDWSVSGLVLFSRWGLFGLLLSLENKKVVISKPCSNSGCRVAFVVRKGDPLQASAYQT